MRIGGGIEKEYHNPDEWLRLVKDLGYSAVLCPVDSRSDGQTRRAYLRAARDADLVIGEVGVWRNCLSKNDRERKAAMEYALAYLLLSKDIINTVRFVTEFYGAPALQTLPVCAQEAVCFFTDYQRNRMNEEEFLYLNRDWCLSHGVEEQTIRRMLQFQEASLRTQGRAPKGFRDTYWYYLMYDNMMMNDKPGTADDNKAIY